MIEKIEKTSRLIIQGQPNDRRRRYHFDVNFPYGHINLQPLPPGAQPFVTHTFGGFGGGWASLNPTVDEIPHRLRYLLWQLAGLTWNGQFSLLGGIAVRTNHLRIVLSDRIPEQRLSAALGQLDDAVIAALGANLLPDGDSGYMWFKDPGPTVEVLRPDWPAGADVFDPEGTQAVPLPAEVDWQLFVGTRFVKLQESFTHRETRRWPAEQRELINGLFWSQGLDSCSLIPGHRGDPHVLTLRKGLAWTWPNVAESLASQFVQPFREIMQQPLLAAA